MVEIFRYSVERRGAASGSPGQEAQDLFDYNVRVEGLGIIYNIFYLIVKLIPRKSFSIPAVSLPSGDVYFHDFYNST